MSLILLGILNSQVSGGAGAPAYEHIATLTGNGSATSLTFTSIPQDYKHLQIRFVARNNREQSTLQNLDFRLNGDNGTNYGYGHALYGNGSVVGSSAPGSDDRMTIAEGMVQNGSGTGIFGVGVIDILDYASTNKNTTLRALHGVNASNSRVALQSEKWLNTAAVTQIEFFTPFAYVTGSRFSLYGIR